MPPTYDYRCAKCDAEFSIIESIKAHTAKGECPTCKNISKERIFSHKVQFIGAAVENAEYNPAFGQVVKSSSHRKELAKQKGLIEVGNESPAKMHKHFDDQRARKAQRLWDED